MTHYSTKIYAFFEINVQGTRDTLSHYQLIPRPTLPVPSTNLIFVSEIEKKNLFMFIDSSNFYISISIYIYY
jgi:hypothetical protein